MNKITKLESENARLKSQIQGLENQIESHRDAYRSLLAQHDEELKKRENERQNLQSALDAARRDIATLQAERSARRLGPGTLNPSLNPPKESE